METSCGLHVNAFMEVLDGKGYAILGPYATFHAAGGETGYNRNCMTSPMGAVCVAMRGGKIAFETACGK